MGIFKFGTILIKNLLKTSATAWSSEITFSETIFSCPTPETTFFSISEHQRKKYNSLNREEKDKRAIYAKNWYNSLPEDIKNIKRAYVRNKYHNMCNDEMLKHKEYQREYQKKLSWNEKGTR